ncbi:MAG: histidine kinase, partial [Spirochaetaceae bacterium]
DFGDYLRSLVTHIIQRHCEHPENIHVEIECGKIFFEIDTAIPAGLIVNELVTNAVLHAFPDGQTGDLKISLTDREQHYFLEVADSGAGFPDGVDVQTGGKLGLELVRALIEQLHGQLSMSRSRGTSIQISIPYPGG